MQALVSFPWEIILNNALHSCLEPLLVVLGTKFAILDKQTLEVHSF